MLLRLNIFRKIIPDQGVDLDGVHIVELLQSLLDLPLVRLDIDDEDEGVVLLDFLHGGLSVDWVDDDLVLVEAGLVGDALARVLWCAGELKGLRAVEGGRQANLADLVRVDLKRPSAMGVLTRHYCVLTPRRVALAAAEALAEGLEPLPVDVLVIPSLCKEGGFSECWSCNAMLRILIRRRYSNRTLGGSGVLWCHLRLSLGVSKDWSLSKVARLSQGGKVLRGLFEDGGPTVGNANVRNG